MEAVRRSNVIGANVEPLGALASVSISIRFTYDEDSNVIMTITGSASQMRASESFRNKRLFPGHRPMGMRKNSVGLKIANGQEQSKLSEFSMGKPSQLWHCKED